MKKKKDIEVPSEILKKSVELERFSEKFKTLKESVTPSTGPDLEFKNFDIHNVGDAIKEKRHEQKMSEKELSILAGVSRSTIQKIESGSTEITLTNLRKTMKALGLELAWK